MLNSKKIVLDPERSFGKPVLTEAGIATEVIYHSWLAEGENARMVASLYEIDVSAVTAAVQFEQRIAAGPIDNNLLPKLAHALRELCSYDQSIEVYALSDKFKPSTKDIDWITELARDGGWVVISQDRFNKGNAEKEALRRSGLTVFFLAKQK